MSSQNGIKTSEDTIEIDGMTLSVVAALGPDGQPVYLQNDLQPEECDHVGQSSSGSLALYCARCGVRLFVPRHFLANLPAATIERMHELWRAAGYPEWLGGGWAITPSYWQIVDHPLFAALGGLPVLHTAMDRFHVAWTQQTAQAAAERVPEERS